MNTPIFDFVTAYAEGAPLRLHMPGHKGHPYLGCEPRDITEIGGADVLYSADGIIAESEANAAALFGTRRTLYSCEGSSLSIRAMLCLVKMYAESRGERPRILAGRNAHRSFMYAAALLDLDVDWILPDGDDARLSVTLPPERLARLLDSDTPPSALYLTAPDYLGCLTDLAPIAELCHRRGILLLVDNAHGAYLRFLPESRHPIDLGADVCADSAHKTLPVLTGGGYLHISKGAPSFFSEMATHAMSLFASTSPSYLILQSLDLANRYLSEGYAGRLAAFSEQSAALKRRLTALGFSLVGDEPLKLTVAAKGYGYTGDELAACLLDAGIVSEFSDPDYLTLMLSPEQGSASLERIAEALTSLNPRTPIEKLPPAPFPSEKRLSIREALFAPSEEIAAADAEGRVLSSAAVACPPAVPILICGEEITRKAVDAFAYYGIGRIRVCK